LADVAAGLFVIVPHLARVHRRLQMRLPNKRLKLTAPGCGRNAVCAPANSVLFSIRGAPTWIGAAA